MAKKGKGGKSFPAGGMKSTPKNPKDQGHK